VGVENADASGLGQRLDEIGEVVELFADVFAVGIINEDGEFEASLVALVWSPVRHVFARLPLANEDVVFADCRWRSEFRAEYGDDGRDGHRIRRIRLLRAGGNDGE